MLLGRYTEDTQWPTYCNFYRKKCTLLLRCIDAMDVLIQYKETHTFTPLDKTPMLGTACARTTRWTPVTAMTLPNDGRTQIAYYERTPPLALLFLTEHTRESCSAPP